MITKPWRRRTVLAVAVLAVVFDAGGCRTSTSTRTDTAPFEARRELGQLSVAYSAESFAARAGDGDTAAIRLFLAAGMSPDSRDGNGSTALMNASAGGHLDVIKLLLAKGAKPNLTNEGDLTALSAAAENGHVEIVRALLDKGADVRAKDPVDQSPLMRAIRGGREDVVTILLGKGADATVQDDQWSALMLAAFLGDQTIVSALLAHDANVNAVNDRGMTSLMLAASRGHASIAQALLAKGAAINAIDGGGHTALMFAANNGHTDLVKLLLHRGADASVQNRAGSTTAALAAGNGHGEIVDLLNAPRSGHINERSAAIELRRLANQSLTFPADHQVYTSAAIAAWRYVEHSFRPTTGLIDATASYPYATIWDVGSGLSALYAGHELSLISTVDYDRRIRRALRTLTEIELFDGAAFNKVYSTTTGAMMDRDVRPSASGYGWSAIDLGRLLVSLRILAVNQPQYRDETAAVVGRLAMHRIVTGGYLHGETLDTSGASERYQEGRLGYEQYAARGFAAWGVVPRRALSWRENGAPVSVMGQSLLADLRGGDRMTSDPLILMGLELGWDRETERLAGQFLAAQRARYRKTGRITMVGEDAMSQPPYYFYFYSALTHGKDFALDAQDSRVAIEEPRWMSAKAAFAWHVLLPSEYTAVALRSVAPARTPDGWASGVYEASGKSTGTLNLNTAAVILTSALVHARGEPLLRSTGTAER